MSLTPDAGNFGIGSWTLTAVIILGFIIVLLFASTLFTLLVYIVIALTLGFVLYIVGARVKRRLIHGKNKTTVESSGGGD